MAARQQAGLRRALISSHLARQRAARHLPASLIALALAATPHAAAAFGPREVVMPTDTRQRTFQEKLGYADAVIADDGTVYLSGVPVIAMPGDGSLDAAFARAFRSIADTLQCAGSGPSDVVEITSYHTDIGPQVAAMARVKSARMPGPPPAWTAVGAAALLDPRAVSEIRVIARQTTPPGR